MITFGQLFLAVSLPTFVALVGVILNQISNKGLGIELKNFRIEMKGELKAINIRLDSMEKINEARFMAIMRELALDKRISNLEREKKETPAQ